MNNIIYNILKMKIINLTEKLIDIRTYVRKTKRNKKDN